jgi:hypothetical protein
LYSSPNIIRMITSRKMRWVERVAVMCAKTNAYRVWCQSHKERDHYKDLDIGGLIILKWILEK